MKTPWTKGPWKIRESSHGIAPFVEADKAPGMAYALDVCGDDYTGYGDDEQREINMRLIALAPEMAQVIIDHEYGGKDDDFREVSEKIKALCNKHKSS